MRHPPYTWKEKNVRDRTVGDAITNAKLLLDGGVCVNALRSRSYEEAITTVELNDLVESMVTESLMYGSRRKRSS